MALTPPFHQNKWWILYTLRAAEDFSDQCVSWPQQDLVCLWEDITSSWHPSLSVCPNKFRCNSDSASHQDTGTHLFQQSCLLITSKICLQLIGSTCLHHRGFKAWLFLLGELYGDLLLLCWFLILWKQLAHTKTKTNCDFNITMIQPQVFHDSVPQVFLQP